MARGLAPGTHVNSIIYADFVKLKLKQLVQHSAVESMLIADPFRIYYLPSACDPVEDLYGWQRNVRASRHR